MSDRREKGSESERVAHAQKLSRVAARRKESSNKADRTYWYDKSPTTIPSTRALTWKYRKRTRVIHQGEKTGEWLDQTGAS